MGELNKAVEVIKAMEVEYGKITIEVLAAVKDSNEIQSRLAICLQRTQRIIDGVTALHSKQLYINQRNKQIKAQQQKVREALVAFRTHLTPQEVEHVKKLEELSKQLEEFAKANTVDVNVSVDIEERYLIELKASLKTQRDFIIQLQTKA
ncbi:hypothetical protein EIN_224210 [Entamoeba invadens IP1]|uniref:Uncharacterized protein n=1 Tax=Entamoeba invadens IP1 TaxID=370355 RepID=A0A0A1U872_ENTIV|nr:hypothetical protein EIN_224210 [Entamoeba invadens IP1]ELP88178.1 hypothetical protein EIN_224210 [Entamoeba invadens IP1]|eukprot:XP_004254949.1 hypothetical protein EIN_224210 [Entamoeba invadens IP1]